MSATHSSWNGFRRIATVASTVSLTLVAFVMLHTQALAEVHVLLVGASKYDHFDAKHQLRNGPANDVAAMAEVLGRHSRKITILADAVPASRQRPTRAAILRELERLSGKDAKDGPKAGDTVVLYFSGHGTQVPDFSGDEQDRLDEAFIPVDGSLGPEVNVSPQSLTVILDDEFGRYITLMRNNGVHVWFILDSCHAGSGARSALTQRTLLKSIPPDTHRTTIDFTRSLCKRRCRIDGNVGRAPAFEGFRAADDSGHLRHEQRPRPGHRPVAFGVFDGQAEHGLPTRSSTDDACSSGAMR